MRFDLDTQRCCCVGLVFAGTPVSFLQHTRRANGVAPSDRFEQRIRIGFDTAKPIERAALKQSAQSLTVRDARALRVFVQLIEQPKIVRARI